MKYFTQFAIIAAFSYCGELIVNLTNIKIPGSMIGLVLFYLSLHFKLIRLEQVKETGDWLKQNLAFFFVPACVGIMAYFDILKTSWLMLSIIMIISTVITFYISGTLAQKLENKEVK